MTLGSSPLAGLTEPLSCSRGKAEVGEMALLELFILFKLFLFCKTLETDFLTSNCSHRPHV